MAPQMPTVFVDNFFDVATLYPAATVGASSYITGREPYRVIDARRDRSWWQPANDGGGSPGNWIAVAQATGVTVVPDYVYVDRGHNLWGRLVEISSSPTLLGAQTTRFSQTVPALNADGSFTPGGDPTTGWCVTEEGALYSFAFGGAVLANAWRFNPPYVAGFVAIVPGLMLGKRTQFLNFSRVRDEDAGNRTEIQEMSRAGYLGTDRRYSWRTFNLDLNYIGATEYDATIRTVVRRWMFELDQPWVGVMDYGTKPERAWMYRWDGTAFSSGMQRTYRGLQIRGREVGPLIR